MTATQRGWGYQSLCAIYYYCITRLSNFLSPGAQIMPQICAFNLFRFASDPAPGHDRTISSHKAVRPRV